MAKAGAVDMGVEHPHEALVEGTHAVEILHEYPDVAEAY